MTKRASSGHLHRFRSPTGLSEFERGLASLIRQKYGAALSQPNTVLHADKVMEELCKTNAELNRKKRQSLRPAVEKALQHLKRSLLESEANNNNNSNSSNNTIPNTAASDNQDSVDFEGIENDAKRLRTSEEETEGSENNEKEETEEMDSDIDFSDLDVPLMKVKNTNMLNLMVRSIGQPSTPTTLKSTVILSENAESTNSNSDSNNTASTAPTSDPGLNANLSNTAAAKVAVLANSNSNSTTNTNSNSRTDIISTPDVSKFNTTPATTPALTRRQQRLVKRSNSTKDGGNSGGSGVTSSSSSSTYSSSSMAVRPSTRYSDVGGIEDVLQDVRELIEYPLTHPEIYTHLGVEPPRGILLHGPPGCGKTLLANAIAGELNLPFFKISAPEIVSGMSGESEARIRELFQEAKLAAPCIIFIDEIDAVTPKRETSQREMEKRIVAQFLTCMDDVSMENTGNKPVCIIGATNRPDSLDPALRRGGRFDREIALGVPDEHARARILKTLSTRLRLSGDFDFEAMGRATAGFVGADLQAVTKEAAVIAVNRIFGDLEKSVPTTASVDKNDVQPMEEDGTEDKTPTAKPTDGVNRGEATNRLRALREPLTPEQLENLYITMEDFTRAIKKVQPSAKREGFATVPDVTWDDIGALENVREDLKMSIVEPILMPERFKALGIDAPVGVLLWGPPGCGKTLLAKAIANESNANFISVKGPELLNKFVGESERSIRQLFQRARMSAPCVIFFDELDALCPRRGGDESSSATSERVVNQLLTEMDGLDRRKQVFIVAATNRPDIIDPAMLRPGRLDKLMYVDLPTAPERVLILKTLIRKTPVAEDVDLNDIANSQYCEHFSGADLAALVRESAVAALREARNENFNNDKPLLVHKQHFEQAFQHVYPSVSKEDQRSYQLLRRKLQSRRANLVRVDVDKSDAHSNTAASATNAISGTGNDNLNNLKDLPPVAGTNPNPTTLIAA